MQQGILDMGSSSLQAYTCSKYLRQVMHKSFQALNAVFGHDGSCTAGLRTSVRLVGSAAAAALVPSELKDQLFDSCHSRPINLTFCLWRDLCCYASTYQGMLAGVPRGVLAACCIA